MLAILFLPFIGIRFGLLSFVNKKALERAAHFAPVKGNEQIAYIVYQLATLGLAVTSLFLSIKSDGSVCFYLGLLSYILGLILCAVTMVHFAFPDQAGFNQKGVYKFSRNPIYLSYFVILIGMSLLAQSLIFGLLTLIFQVSGHWIILSEERWCRKQFGQAYGRYRKAVRRYF